MESILPEYRWPRIKRALLITRLLSAIIYVTLCFTGDLFHSFFGDRLLVPALLAVTISTSDFITIFFTPRQYSSHLSVTTLFFELIIIMVSVYWLAYCIILFPIASQIRRTQIPSEVLSLLVMVPIFTVSVVMIVHDGRALPENWRMKRGSRKVRPLLVFTKTGDPLAVLPIPQPDEGENAARLSLDSLQQFTGEASV
ncbi:hypothetical protein GGR51DRAFT_530057, partial [Nemania sp. FL0031]